MLLPFFSAFSVLPSQDSLIALTDENDCVARSILTGLAYCQGRGTDANAITTEQTRELYHTLGITRITRLGIDEEQFSLVIRRCADRFA